MHLLIPFASTLSEACVHTVRDLKLPNLVQLLGYLGQTPAHTDAGDEMRFSPPHERALGALYGWTAEDGLLPWGAHQAAADGVDTGSGAWALLTPVHMHVGTDQITLLDPSVLQLEADESRAFIESMRELFESAGWRIEWGSAARWYASHASLAALPTASIDRAIGRSVDAWLPQGLSSRQVRGLQNEVQMLLYELKLNDARTARGQLAVNSFWVSGCGARQAAHPPADLIVDARLRGPALTEEWADWAAAWAALDAGPIADLLREAKASRPARLTLCGERHAHRFEAGNPSLWKRFGRRFSSIDPSPLLESL